MSTRRRMSGGWVRRSVLRGPNGRGICRWCGAEVPKGRRTFCDDACVHDWRLRSDPGYLRRQVLARDRGVCAICGLDTLEFTRRLKILPFHKRNELKKSLGIPRRRNSFWDADHVLAIAEGGGECSLSNIRTLCLWCHEAATERLRERLRQKSARP